MPHLLKQRYLITETLGRGGMGVVYKAHDTLLGNRFVAIKEMQQSNDDQYAVEAFKHEAEILAHLMHPHLPSIHEHFTESGCWYLVMEFIEGQTLEKYVKAKGGWLGSDEVIEIGLQLCTILDYLHTRQPPIVFRDLKPLNIMLSSDGHLYLIDFGIARHFKRGQASDTAIAFSVGYAAPEQYPIVSTQTTPLSDIYSLGATLHRLLTGNNPSLNKPTPFNFPPLQFHEPTASQELAALIMQMVEPEAHNRPASVAHIKQQLQYIAAQRVMSPAARGPEAPVRALSPIAGWPGAPVRALSPVAGWPEVPAHVQSTVGWRETSMDKPTFVSSSPRVTKRGISRRVVVASLATLTLAGGGMIGWSILRGQPTSASAPTSNKPNVTSAPTSAPTSVPTLAPGARPVVPSLTLEVAFSTDAVSNSLTTLSSLDGVTWPTNVQAQSQIQIQGSPAIAILNYKRYMAFVGNKSNNTLYLTSSNNQNWPAAQPTNMYTQENPSMVAFNGKLYLAFTANDGSNLLYISSSTDGQNWSAATSPNSIHLKGGPALAVFNQTLYVAFRAGDVSNSLCLASSTDGQKWSIVTEYGGLRMQGDPTMAQFNNNLYIAFRSYDSSNSLFVSSSADGQNWPTATSFGQFLQGNPSMVAFGDNLYIAYRANDSSNSLFVTSSANGQNWSVNEHFGVAMQDSPTIAGF